MNALENQKISAPARDLLSDLTQGGFKAEVLGRKVRVTHNEFPFLAFIGMSPRQNDLDHLRAKAKMISAGDLEEMRRVAMPRDQIGKRVIKGKHVARSAAEATSTIPYMGTIKGQMSSAILSVLKGASDPLRTREVRGLIPNEISSKYRTQEAFRSALSALLREMSENGSIARSKDDDNNPLWSAKRAFVRY